MFSVVTASRQQALAGLALGDALISIRDGRDQDPLPVPRDLYPAGVLDLRFDDLWLPMPKDQRCWDHLVFPNADHVQAAIAFVRAAKAKGAARIVIHCTAGVSRSGAIAYAVFADHYGLHTQAAVTCLLTHNSAIWPNPLIVALADKLLGRNGALTSALKRDLPGWGLSPADDRLMHTHFGLDKPPSWSRVIRLANDGLIRSA